MLNRSLDHPNWAPLLIIWKRNIVTATFLVELPSELGRVICTGIVGTCNCCGNNCESRGLSNLTPARSRLFKLKGGKGVCEVELQQATSIWWLQRKRESEKRRQSTVEKLEVIKK